MNAPSSFQTAQEVIDIQNRALKIVSGGIHTRNDSENRDLIERIRKREAEKLEAFRDLMARKEEQFYNSLGIDGYKELYNKTRDWQKSGASKLLKDSSLIAEIQTVFDDASKIDLETVVFKFSNRVLTKEQLISLFGEEIDELINDEAPKQVIAEIKGGTSSRSGTLSLSFKDTSIGNKKNYIKSKNTKGITFFQRGKTSKSKDSNFEIHFTKDISYGNQEKLKLAFAKILEEEGESTDSLEQKELYIKIQSKILSCLPAYHYPRANEIIKRTILNFIIDDYKIAISKNASAIRGALGEIYWAAFFDFLGVRVIPAGFDARTIGGKQLPIDLVFEKFGFQVKNYTQKDGLVTFNQHYAPKLKQMVPNEVSLGWFFSNGLDLGDSAKEALGKFYFSRNYNIRNVEKDPDGNYIPIENRFDPISNAIFSYAEANAHKLLNMDRQIELKAPDMFDVQLNAGRPIMFFINEQPLPASEMIQEIIDGLMNDGEQEIFINIKNLSFELTPFDLSVHWDDEVPMGTNISQRLSKARASYKIDIHVDNLLSKILSRMK